MTKKRTRKRLKKPRAGILGKLTINVESIPNPEYEDLPDAECTLTHVGLLPNPEEILSAIAKAMIRSPTILARIEGVWGTASKWLAVACLQLDAGGIVDNFEETLIDAKMELLEQADADPDQGLIRATLEMGPTELRELADEWDKLNESLQAGTMKIEITREDTSDAWRLCAVSKEQD